METTEQTNSVNNSSAFGDISVLTPSQKREQERLRKEVEARKEAKQAKKRLAEEKKINNLKRMKRICILSATCFGVFIVIFGICFYNYEYNERRIWMIFSILTGIGTVVPAVVFSIYYDILKNLKK